jgi:aspartyl-tRNA synthetase
MIRSVTCGQLNKNDIGKEAVMCGWVHRRRDHGKLIFIDMRDRYGLTQVVFNPKENPQIKTEAEKLRPEFVIRLQGKVNLRPKGTENPKIPTGEVEVVATELEILNPAQTPVFEIDDSISVSEELQLAYRYLDLRRPVSLNALLLRHKICKFIRDYFDENGFVEVETPILTKSTPEGARDFLVPSRLNPGYFFALPQSPQLFKQLLMVSGLDRYFQIAKCFRDEDLRSDRQPEFTQLDLEMSFIDEEDIYKLIEGLFAGFFKKVMGKDLTTPFPRLTYQQAQ